MVTTGRSPRARNTAACRPAGHGPGVQLAVELGCASADHFTYLTDDDIEALAASTTVATFLPPTDFSTHQPYPDTAPRRSSRGDGGARHQLSPASRLHSSIASASHSPYATSNDDQGRLCGRPRWAGGCVAAPRVGTAGAGLGGRRGCARPPSYARLVYRPGMQLVAETIEGARLTTASASGE